MNLENCWPGPNAARLVAEFELTVLNEEMLTSRICEGGRYEIGFGNTYYEDGTPVKPGETITEERAYALRAMALRKEWLPVRAALRFVPNQNQIDALAVAAYNLGGGAVARSDMVQLANAGRWEDAAAAFSDYIGSTSPGPSDREIAKGWIPAGMKWGRFPDKSGRSVSRWLDAQGNPCNYFRRLRGLLRRRHAEACLFLGLRWMPACQDSAVFLNTNRVWNEVRGYWEDKVRDKREFAQILEVARKYPLLTEERPAIPAPPPEPPPPPPVILVEALPELPPTPAPEPVLETAAQTEETPMSTEVKPATKHPLQSSTIWGIMILALVPQLDGLAQAFGTMGEQVSGPLSGVFQIVGLWLGIAGRFGASLALAIPGKK